MSPDSPETRLGRLEREVSALQQRMTGLEEMQRQLGPLVKDMATVAGDVRHVEQNLKLLRTEWGEDVQDFKQHIGATNRRLDDYEVERRKDRETSLRESAAWRKALVLGSLAVLSAVVTAAGAVIAAVI